MRAKRPRPRSDHVRYGGRDWPVLDRVNLGRRTYLVLDSLGHAGRERYRAFDPHAGRRGQMRALLVLPRSPAAQQHVRALERATANNPTLPTLLDYQARSDRLTLVLTWVHGPDLQAFLDQVRAGRRPRPSPYEAVRLIRGLAHGRRHLHRQTGVIHGDLKPANLILAREPARLVTVDFGSAWLVEKTNHRIPGDGITPAYAAPELQGAAAPVDFRSDQFSATVLLYELLTLAIPYDNLGGQAGRPEYHDEPTPTLIPPSKLSPDRSRLPPAAWNAIDTITTKSLALDPNARYDNPGPWLNALDDCFRSMQPTASLGTLNGGMTRVMEWLAEKLRFNEDAR